MNFGKFDAISNGAYVAVTVGSRAINRVSNLRPINQEQKLREYYLALYRAWGAQHWWPAETRFEVIVGAYLTQNTAWTNVEQALANLRDANLLSVEGIRKVRLSRLERLIRPSGYFQIGRAHV